MTQVGVAGAGRMGLPIIGHLVRAGHDVTVCERDESRRGLVADARAAWAESVAEMASCAQVILVCVGYDREVSELMHAEGGILGTAPAGCIVAVLSTVMPETVAALADAGAARGISVIDTTVCRGSWEADAGTLLSFVGGPADIFDRLHDVIGSYSSDIIHSGPVGTAQVCKAANNLILWACLIADHEGLALAERYGVDTEALRQALLISSATNGALSVWGRQTMAWAEDDMVIVRAMAAQQGIGLPQAGLNTELCRSLKPRRYRLAEYGQ